MIGIVERGQQPLGFSHFLFRTFDALAQYRSPRALPMQPLTACCTTGRRIAACGPKDLAA